MSQRNSLKFFESFLRVISNTTNKIAVAFCLRGTRCLQRSRFSLSLTNHSYSRIRSFHSHLSVFQKLADAPETVRAIPPHMDPNGVPPAGGKAKTQKERTIIGLPLLTCLVEKEAKKAAKAAKFEAKKVSCLEYASY